LLRTFNTNYNDFYNLEFTQFYNNTLLNINNKSTIINNIILFKKQSIFFKKTNNKSLFLLNFLDSFKYDEFNSINDELSNDLIINNGVYFYNLDFIKLNNNLKKEIEYVNFVFI
jgi:hypothetical protein